MLKFLKRLGFAVGVLLALCTVVIALNFTYLKRSLTGFDVEQVREVSWYQPQVSMSHSSEARPLTRSNSLDSQEQRFSEAVAYAEELNTSAFLVYQGGELLVEKYWAPYHAESYTQTQSVHKSLLALAVGVAIEEGDMGSVSDPVSDYLGDWIDQSLGEIRVEHLLNMSSGLGKEPGKIFLFNHFLRLLNSTDISKVAQSLPQKLAPGQEFEYINNNPQLLVDVLEQATGQPYEAYLQDKIWSKMAANPGYLWMDREDGTPHGYCCLIALPEDLLRIGLLILNKGQVGGEQVVPELWIERTMEPSELNPNYGYLIWRGSPHTRFRKYAASSEFGVVHSEPYLADDLIYFDGFGGQRVYVVPSRELVIVRVGETRFDFDDSVLPNRVIEALDYDRVSKSVFDIAHEDISIETAHSGDVAVRISYPVGEEQAFPLVIFSHGHYLANTDYHALTDRWVERGYIVAAPLHLDTGEMQTVQKLGEELGSDWISAARVLDMQAVIDQIGPMMGSIDGFVGDVNFDQVIAAGHSYGALTAQILAGAIHTRQDNSIYPIPDTLSDERVDAVVAISPPGLIPGYIEQETWEMLSIPQLVVTGTDDVFEYVWQDYREHLVSYNTALPGDNYILVIDGMDHYLGNLIGRLDREEEAQQGALDLLLDRSLLFMDSYLGTGTSQESHDRLNRFDEFPQKPGVTTYERR